MRPKIIRRYPYVIIPTELNRFLDGNEVRIYIEIRSRLPNAFASHKTISKKLRLSERTVERITKKLHTMGLFRIEKRGRHHAYFFDEENLFPNKEIPDTHVGNDDASHPTSQTTIPDTRVHDTRHPCRKIPDTHVGTTRSRTQIPEEDIYPKVKSCDLGPIGNEIFGIEARVKQRHKAMEKNE